MSQPKPKILVLFYSMYGHIFAMAKTVAEGVLEAGGEPIVKQVAELIPKEFWDDGIRKAKETMKEIPVADPRKDLKGINGLIVGTPTRFGNMTSQMRNFWDQTGGDWMSGTLIGKPAAVFTSSATQHGGARDHHPLDHDNTPAPRLCFGRFALLFQRANDAGRNYRGLAIRGFNHRWPDGRADALEK